MDRHGDYYSAVDDVTAEEIMGAALDLGIADTLLEELMGEFEATGWARVGEKSYPPCYAYALGRYRANPEAVERMRWELSSVPRVNPEEYDILLNIEGSDVMAPGPTWDVVKWMRIPEIAGCLPGYGWMATVTLDPFPVYWIPAARGVMSLSDRDFNQMRQNATTLRDGGKGINKRMLHNNLKVQEDARKRRADEDLDFAEYYRDLFKREGEALGV